MYDPKQHAEAMPEHGTPGGHHRLTVSSIDSTYFGLLNAKQKEERREGGENNSWRSFMEADTFLAGRSRSVLEDGREPETRQTKDMKHRLSVRRGEEGK